MRQANGRFSVKCVWESVSKWTCVRAIQNRLRGNAENTICRLRNWAISLRIYSCYIWRQSKRQATMLNVIRVISSTGRELPAHNRMVSGSSPGWPTIRGRDGMVDIGDLKSPGSDTVWVRVPSPAPWSIVDANIDGKAFGAYVVSALRGHCFYGWWWLAMLYANKEWLTCWRWNDISSSRSETYQIFV